MRNPTPPPSHRSRRSPRIPKENADPNRFLPEPPHFKSPSSVGKPLRSPLRPRPPNTTGNPLKRKLNLETALENGVPTPSESGVQVVVRMRPVNGMEEVGDRIVRKISGGSVSVLDHAFTFDFVADTDSTQQEMFQLVGIPLVENCLAGFNSSIFAYGQTGSGKTYTVWGPPNALLEDDMASDARGLTPRVFERLFDRIKEEQSRHSDKQQAYQCRCSFLEIYNEQITDLLDPHQGNLQIREDVRTGVYVENLTEDYVCSMKDVKQLLIKGLVNRRCGATSINAESSRSHCVFTCVVESKTKCVSDGLSSVRISRINLVDLAGSERQNQTGATGECLKEAGNINRSLSQLGNLINILAEISQSGKQRHIPYRDSRLTFLLQESLGGNAKLAMICTISPSQSCKSETISTLRFAQRAKAIKNKAVVNKVRRDDVNVLREQIRQLKDELLLMKSNGGATGNSQSSLTGWNTKRSLNILRQSLRYPMAIPAIEDDNDEEMEIDEGEVENSSILVGLQTSEDDMSIMDTLLPQMEVLEEPSHLCCNKYVDKDVLARQSAGVDCNNDQGTEVAMDVCEPEQISVDQLGLTPFPTKKDSTSKCHGKLQKSLRLCHGSIEGNIAEDNVPLRDSSMQSGSNSKAPSLNLDVKVGFSHDPSPSLIVAEDSSRKSKRTSLSMSASCRRISEDEQSGQEVQSLYFTQLSNNCPSTVPFTQMSNHSLAPTRNLATSLHHGLQVINFHRQTVPLRMFSFGFPSKAVDSKVLLPVAKVDFGMQTLSQGPKISEDPNFMCTYCKNRQHKIEYRDVGVDTELELVPPKGSNSIGKSIKQVPRAVEKVLAGAIRREMALEDHCASQAAEITHLNRLVQQYKHERECNTIIEQTLEDKICRDERLLDCIIPSEHFMEEDYMSLVNEHKRLKDKYENHPEVLRLHIEVRRARDELDKYRNFFDLGERDVLMEEIQDLRNQLQNYIDCSPSLIQKTSLFPQLKHINEPIVSPLCGASGLSAEFTEKMFEEERGRWTEAESKWISFSEELRLELEATRSLAEKQKVELDLEKKCLEELKEALRTAMQGHVHILDQYADLQEKHIALLARHRKIRDGIVDVKKAASRAGIKGAESKFIDSLAAEISALKAEREEERLYWRDENKGLQSQLRDTAEALQAAGELLLRLKEAEDAAATAQRRTAVAENETENAYKEMHSLKKKQEKEITMLNHFHAESHNTKVARKPLYPDRLDADADKQDGVESPYSTLERGN